MYIYILMQGIGDINYSLDKNKIHPIIITSIIHFTPFYFILIIMSFIYIFTIRYQKFNFLNRINEDIVHFFKSITYNSPFKILELSKNDNFVGLSNHSYIFIIITYIITLIIILEGLMRNLLLSFYSNMIQINKNNNPYNNPNCITKISNNPIISIQINYMAIITLSISYLIPFLIPFLISFLKFDNYDIKHNSWFSYIVLFLVFYPFIIILLSKKVFFKKLQIFPELNKFIESIDYDFTTFIKNNFNNKFYNIIPFLFIIFIYLYYTFIYTEFKYNNNNKYIIYLLIILIIFIFIPFFIIFFILSLLFNNNYKNKTDNNVENIINNIENNSVKSIYELLVKYNYPCFEKKS